MKENSQVEKNSNICTHRIQAEKKMPGQHREREKHYSRLPYPAEEGVRQKNRIRLFITTNIFQFALEGICRPCARAGNHNLGTSVLSFEDGNTTFLTANDYTSRNRAWTLVSLLHFSIKLFTNRFLNERKNVCEKRNWAVCMVFIQ